MLVTFETMLFRIHFLKFVNLKRFNYCSKTEISKVSCIAQFVTIILVIQALVIAVHGRSNCAGSPK